MSSRPTPTFEARPGIVYLVGAGPGDPGLMTLRAAGLLRTADLVLHDQLVTPEILAMADVGAEVLPVGRRCGKVVVPHEQVVARMVEGAKAGKRVVRLKGGDPMVFGRGGEEAGELLDEGVPIEIVSGVSSAISGPASAGIPVTHRDVSRGFLVVTAHTLDGSERVDWEVVAKFTGTVVVMMGHRHWDPLTTKLIDLGRRPDEPAAAIAWASTPRQHVVTATLDSISEAARAEELGTPAVLVLGEVVNLHDTLAAVTELAGAE